MSKRKKKASVEDLTIQWCRDGVPIPGATGATYVVQPADDRTVLTCRVVSPSIAKAADGNTIP